MPIAEGSCKNPGTSLQRKCSKMTAERTSIYGKVGVVGRHKMNDAAKAMLSVTPCVGSTNRCSEWNQLEHNIGRVVRGDALALLSTSREILTSGQFF